MGSPWMLSKQKIALFSCLLLFGTCISAGCKGNVVKYEYFIEKPSASRTSGVIEINLGYTRASANWIKSHYQIEQNTIYLSGELTFKEIPQKIIIKLPDPNAKYRIFWIDEDGKKFEIPVSDAIGNVP